MHSEIVADITLRKGVGIQFARELEASIDCHVCRRSRRTIILREGEAESVCSPTRHPFPGRIEELFVTEPRFKLFGGRGVARAAYRVGYDFEPFIDAKYPTRGISPDVTWARVSFILTCSCGKMQKHSTQNNIVRPWTATCGCGKALFFEVDEMPLLATTRP